MLFIWCLNIVYMVFHAFLYDVYTLFTWCLYGVIMAIVINDEDYEVTSETSTSVTFILDDTIRRVEQGDLNVRVGRPEIKPAQEGDWNVGVGRPEVKPAQEGDWNVGVGRPAVKKVQEGDWKVRVGRQQAKPAQEGDWKTSIGIQEIRQQQEGDWNTRVNSSGASQLGEFVWMTAADSTTNLLQEDDWNTTTVGLDEGTWTERSVEIPEDRKAQALWLAATGSKQTSVETAVPSTSEWLAAIDNKQEAVKIGDQPIRCWQRDASELSEEDDSWDAGTAKLSDSELDTETVRMSGDDEPWAAGTTRLSGDDWAAGVVAGDVQAGWTEGRPVVTGQEDSEYRRLDTTDWPQATSPTEEFYSYHSSSSSDRKEAPSPTDVDTGDDQCTTIVSVGSSDLEQKLDDINRLEILTVTC